MKIALVLTLSLLLPTWSSHAADVAARPPLEITAKAEVDVTVKNADGHEEVKAAGRGSARRSAEHGGAAPVAGDWS
jgi:hypothetical protein